MKNVVISVICGIVAFTASVSANDRSAFGLSPAACEDAVVHYLSQRVVDPRGINVALSGEPYAVTIKLRGGREVSGWAVRVRAKHRGHDGRYGAFKRYTVLFKNGRAIALKRDVDNVKRA
ncbi:MAG: hypothetical protein AAGB02_08570 [Pseudomonadota bacterium]